MDYLHFNWGETPNHVIIERCEGEPQEWVLNREDAALLTEVVNQGIDSHLEAVCHGSTFEWVSVPITPNVTNTRLVCHVSPEDIPVILRRLLELEGTDDRAASLRYDILHSLGIEED